MFDYTKMQDEAARQDNKASLQDRRRQDIWDREHMRTVSTHLRETENILLIIACTAENKTRYAVMQELAREFIADWWEIAEEKYPAQVQTIFENLKQPWGGGSPE